MSEQKFKLHDRVTDGTVIGEIVQIDGYLYLLEYELWPKEPLRSVWRTAEELRHKPLAVVELARAD